MLTEWLLLGLGVLLTLGTGVAVAAEFSLITLDRASVEREAEGGSRSAQQVLEGLRSLSTQLSGAQVAITVTTLLVGFLVEPSLSRLLEGPLTTVGLPESFLTPVSVGLGIALATLVSMLAGELIPKNLALSVPMATARWSVPLQRLFTTAVKPLIVVLNGSANRVLRSWGIEPQEELATGRSSQELSSLVRRSADAGTLDAGTATLLTRSLGFSQHTAADVMTDRLRMVSVRRDDTAADVVRISRSTGYSRFPVVDESQDDIVGVVHLKRAVAVPRERREEVPAGALMQEALRVPETVRLDPLLVELRDHGMPIAVVIDEYGGTSGVVTLEDVIEELVGEVADEHDRTRTGINRTKDGNWMLPGLIRPDEVRERLGLDVPDGHAYETLAGFVMARLGRLPRTGDEVVVGGGLLTVAKMQGRRIERIRFRAVGGATVTDGPGAAGSS